MRPASADASFRRYLRIDATGTDVSAPDSFIIMDAPPEKEDCAPFVKVAGLMAQAGLNVPRVLEWDETRGFMLLDDLGTQTMIEVVDPDNASSNQGLYLRAVDALVAWQAASQAGRPAGLRRGPAGARTGAVSRTGTWSAIAASRSKAGCAKHWTASSG